MKVIKNIALKSAIALTLMTGNIIPPANVEFYEDDASFHQTSSQLTSGWGWGFNKAYAACDDQSVADDATSPDECIDVIGDRYEESSYQESSSEESSSGGATGGGGGGGPSDDSDEEEQPPPKTEEELKECRQGVDELVRHCKSTYAQYNAGIAMLCSEFSFRLLKHSCNGLYVNLQLKAYDWCHEMGKQKKARECN